MPNHMYLIILTPAALRRAESHGRPLGSTGFAPTLETQLACPILPRKRGLNPKATSVPGREIQNPVTVICHGYSDWVINPHFQKV